MFDPTYFDEDYFKGGTKSKDYSPSCPYDWDHRKAHMEANVRDLQSFCLPFKTVLDVGCATGLLVRALIEAGHDARGIDVSPWAISNVDTKAAGRVCLAPAWKIPAPDKSFDLVVSLDTLEHVNSAKIGACLDEMMRVANREIVVRLPVVSEEEWKKLPDPSAWAETTGDASHVFVATPEYWISAIRQRGWLLVAKIHAADLTVLDYTTYFVARRPEFKAWNRATKP